MYYSIDDQLMATRGGLDTILCKDFLFFLFHHQVAIESNTRNIHFYNHGEEGGGNINGCYKATRI